MFSTTGYSAEHLSCVGLCRRVREKLFHNSGNKQVGISMRSHGCLTLRSGGSVCER